MGHLDLVLGWLSSLLLISLLVNCVPLSPRTSWSGKPHKASKQDSAWVSLTAPPLPELRTVFVRCHESVVEIVVKADLYGTGAMIDGSDLRLGWHPLIKGAKPAAKCGAVASSEVEYVIIAELTDCGTELVFTNDWLVYKNSVFYSPAPSPDGIVRLEETVIPFECHYARQYSVNSNSLVPTWVPFVSTQFAEDAFYFSLRLLTADWYSERPTNVYFLGDVIHLEATVVQGNHVPLRVFVDTCMATLVPDVNSDPRYPFIENGCLTDARMTGSISRFLPRTQDNTLQIQLEAFRFYQDSRDSVKSWLAADGNDHACGSCEGRHSFSSGKKTTQFGVWKRGTKADTGAAGNTMTQPAGVSALEKNVTIGPIIFRECEVAGIPEVLVAEQSGTSVGTPAILGVAGSAVDLSEATTESGTVVDTPIAAILETGQATASNSTPPLIGPSGSSVDAPSGLSLEAGTIEDTLAASTEMTDALVTSVLEMEQVENSKDLKTEEADSPLSQAEVVEN